MQLSTGPWSYNRFNAYEQSLTEGAKPDYLDFDKDGDKKEPMKKALKEKGKKQVDEGKGEMPDFIKDKVEGKKSPCEKCKEEGKKDCKCDDDKSVKEHVIQSLIDDGLANNVVSAEIIAEHMSAEWTQAILDELA